MRTGFVWHERFAWHDAGLYPSSPASPVEPYPTHDIPATRRRLRNLIDVSGLLARLTILPVPRAEDGALLRVHTPQHLSRLEAASAGPHAVDVGSFARMNPGGMETLRLGAGGVIACVDAVLDGRVANAYALVRPPGHHATANAAMGFCLVNNLAVGAAHARARGIARVAVVDWDVHHGNGTESIFAADPSVLTISIHQDGLLRAPGGHVGDVGEGPGRGTSLNIPLPPGSGHEAYLAALDRIVLPAFRRFQPGLIMVACGLDAHQNDPLGRMMLHSGSFRAMTARVLQAASELCGGRLVMCHEGGYAPVHAPFAGLAIIEQLSDETTGVVDPFLAAGETRPGFALEAHQDAVLGRVEAEALPLISATLSQQ